MHTGSVLHPQFSPRPHSHFNSNQLYFEEIKFLESIGQDISAKWVYENVSEHIRKMIDEIQKFIDDNSNENSIYKGHKLPEI